MPITDVSVADNQESRRGVIGRTEFSYCQILRTVEAGSVDFHPVTSTFLGRLPVRTGDLR